MTEAALIALLPLIGYYIALSWEYGYAKYFEIPEQIVSVGYSGFYRSFIGLLAIFLIMFLMYTILSNFCSQKVQRESKIFHPAGPLAFHYDGRYIGNTRSLKLS